MNIRTRVLGWTLPLLYAYYNIHAIYLFYNRGGKVLGLVVPYRTFDLLHSLRFIRQFYLVTFAEYMVHRGNLLRLWYSIYSSKTCGKIFWFFLQDRVSNRKEIGQEGTQRWGRTPVSVWFSWWRLNFGRRRKRYCHLKILRREHLFGPYDMNYRRKSVWEIILRNSAFTISMSLRRCAEVTRWERHLSTNIFKFFSGNLP